MEPLSNFYQPIPNFAIVICTFNPDERLLRRVLEAVANLEIATGLTLECVIVDNNSDFPVAQLPVVKNFLECCAWAKVIVELQQGLSFARITGVQATQAPTIVFFDDDNEPRSDYLLAAQGLLQHYQGVAAWGPGQVHVDFVDPVLPKFKTHFQKMFQARQESEIQFGCLPAAWAPYYPFGTGLVLRRAVFEHYMQAAQCGQLTAIDRKGTELTSGGDIQIVWEAIKMGFSAGVAPQMALTHMIPGSRANLSYIRRLSFGTASSYIPALTQSFPTIKAKYLHPPSSTIKLIAGMLLKIARSLPMFHHEKIVLEWIGYLGYHVGVFRTQGQLEPAWLQRLITRLNLN
jgi:glycosyltransferase involved in cell wall biosynthesis